MLSLAFIRANPDIVQRAAIQKNVLIDVAEILSLDKEIRTATTAIELLRKERKAVSATFQSHSVDEQANLREKVRRIVERIEFTERLMLEKQAELTRLLLQVPNIPWEGAPVGPDESYNVVLRREGTIPSFNFEPLDHVALLEKNDWADLGRITQVAGSRQYCLKGRLALLEQALMLWAQKRLASDGFTLMTVPALARSQAFFATGHFPGNYDDIYRIARGADEPPLEDDSVPETDLFLAGTGEVALTSLHSGEIFEPDRLPILYAGYSPCFRREAGSAGRDVRGLLRVHQFYKLEQYVICRDDDEESARWHERLLANAEAMLRALEIPYQVIETSTGDMGNGKYRMNDIESWVPSLSKYRETHSCSTLHDWQARRANLRWRDEERKVRFVHTLNNTALASPRILVPLLENHQTADGRVRLPEALRELMDGEYL